MWETFGDTLVVVIFKEVDEVNDLAKSGRQYNVFFLGGAEGSKCLHLIFHRIGKPMNLMRYPAQDLADQGLLLDWWIQEPAKLELR